MIDAIDTNEGKAKLPPQNQITSLNYWLKKMGALCCRSGAGLDMEAGRIERTPLSRLAGRLGSGSCGSARIGE
jgi:hypothetical protein